MCLECKMNLENKLKKRDGIMGVGGRTEVSPRLQSCSIAESTGTL